MRDDEAFSDEAAIEFIRSELKKTTPSRRRLILEKFALAAMGSIPWVGGFISASVSLKMEQGGIHRDSLQTKWLEEHAAKLERLKSTLEEVVERFEAIGEQVDERIQTDEYLDLVRRAFRAWDRADTDEKRGYVANLCF